MKTFRWIVPFAAAVLALPLAGCWKKAQTPQTPVRPVLSVAAQPQTSRLPTYLGTVEPRYQSNLGFRVLGRVVTRDVNVGDHVERGARLASLDPVSFDMTLRSAQADLSKAQAQLDNAEATKSRQRALLERNTVSEAQVEAAERARDTAAAAVAQARAVVAKAQEQVGYTLLRSDYAGVVTAANVQVGQVVSPGQTVVVIARPDVREAVIDVSLGTDLKPGTRFDVALQLETRVRVVGQVREIEPQADPVTRTRRVRITLDDPPASFRLGAGIAATPVADGASFIELPLSALLERDGRTMVWVIEPADKTVSMRDVTVASRDKHTFRVAEGVAPGVRVVIAGVHSLTPGQPVKVSEEETR